MRVIAGKFKGRKLELPNSNNSRPTSDKVKEAIFSAIGKIDDKAIFYDVFACTGQMGIEFVSRGGGISYFSEVLRGNVDILIKNINSTISKCGKVKVGDARRIIKKLYLENIKFDYIYLDPPYNKGIINEVFILLDSYNILKDNAIIITESSKDEEIYVNDLYDLFYDREYGKIRIRMYRYHENNLSRNI